MEQEIGENICINCKRCTNSDTLFCCWADKGLPVEGWTAKVGQKYTVQRKDKNGNIHTEIVTGYHITACPLFVKDKPFTTQREMAEIICKTLGITMRQLYYKWLHYLKEYEQVTNTKIPAWAIELPTRKTRKKDEKNTK